MPEADILAQTYLTSIFEQRDEGAIPVCFDMEVLQKYAGGGYTLMRSKNAGLLRARQGWRLDFGIADEAGIIHTSIGDVFKLPKSERSHFATYLKTGPLNGRFIQMRLGGGACVDDGETVSWDGTPHTASSE